MYSFIIRPLSLGKYLYLFQSFDFEMKWIYLNLPSLVLVEISIFRQSQLKNWFWDFSFVPPFTTISWMGLLKVIAPLVTFLPLPGDLFYMVLSKRGFRAFNICKVSFSLVVFWPTRKRKLERKWFVCLVKAAFNRDLKIFFVTGFVCFRFDVNLGLAFVIFVWFSGRSGKILLKGFFRFFITFLITVSYNFGKG